MNICRRSTNKEFHKKLLKLEWGLKKQPGPACLDSTQSGLGKSCTTIFTAVLLLPLCTDHGHFPPPPFSFHLFFCDSPITTSINPLLLFSSSPLPFLWTCSISHMRVQSQVARVYVPAGRKQWVLWSIESNKESQGRKDGKAHLGTFKENTIFHTRGQWIQSEVVLSKEFFREKSGNTVLVLER